MAAPRLETSQTILVVEDNEQVRALAARALREQGYRVLEAPDGLAALDVLARGEEIHLVITDVVMPRMGGFEFAARLESRSSHPTVLFMSGYGSNHLEVPGPLLQKPFSPGMLQAEVQRLLGNGAH